MTGRLLRIARLLLEVYGGLFLLVMVSGLAFQGVTPYQSLLSLGTLRFYFLMAAAFVLWLGLSGLILRRRAGDPPSTPPATHDPPAQADR